MSPIRPAARDNLLGADRSAMVGRSTAAAAFTPKHGDRAVPIRAALRNNGDILGHGRNSAPTTTEARQAYARFEGVRVVGRCRRVVWMRMGVSCQSPPSDTQLFAQASRAAPVRHKGELSLAEGGPGMGNVRSEAQERFAGAVRAPTVAVCIASTAASQASRCRSNSLRVARSSLCVRHQPGERARAVRHRAELGRGATADQRDFATEA